MPFMQAKHRQVHLRTRVFFSKEACSMSEPTAIFSIYDDKDKEIREVLTSVYRALKEKGYNPSTSWWAISSRKTLPTSPLTRVRAPTSAASTATTCCRCC